MKTTFGKRTLVYLILFILIATFLSPGVSVSAQNDVQYYAVIVGISEYQNYTDLDYCDNDARALYQQLEPIWGEENVRLMTNDIADKNNIEGWMTDWLPSVVDENDVVLFYFSGYSYNSEYLMCHDSLAGSFANDISPQELDGWLDGLDSQKILTIIETSLNHSATDVFLDVGRVIMVANQETGDAYSTSEFEAGVYTYYLLEAMNMFDLADENNDFRLSALEIHRYADTKTKNWAADKGVEQDPNLISMYFTGDPPIHEELVLLMKITVDANNIPAQEGAISVERTVGGLVVTTTFYQYPASLISAPGSEHRLSAQIIISGSQGTRYQFNNWGDGNSSASRTISQGGVYTANYLTEYKLTVQSEFGSPSGDGWYKAGSLATLSASSVDGAVARHIFKGWSGDFVGSSETAEIIMDSPKTVVAEWQSEYLLTISSTYGDPDGGGWYDAGSLASISVPESVGLLIRQVFQGWSGDFTGDSANSSVLIDGPKTVTATWKTDYTQLYLIAGGGAVVLGAIIALFVARVRRRKALVRSVSKVAETKEVAKCPNCGAESQPGDIFCAECGKPLAQ